MKKIHGFMNEIKIYLQHSIQSMEQYLEFSTKLTTHGDFCVTFTHELDALKKLQQQLLKITDFKYNIQKISQIGHILKTFYELHTNETYEQCILYSFGFHGYIDCLQGLQQNIKERKINYSLLTKKKNKNIFKNIYYPTLKDINHIKNDINLDKHIIISGPNASGKTTILKSTLFNIIFTQQFGCGFYDSAILNPYHHLHCYLNIPDTSGRDSLFQAEARRCKDIIDYVVEHNEDTHFCAFDELYSGTNPEEATLSAIAFMQYIAKNNNICSMLTTHFIDVCKKLDTHKNIKNFQMYTKKDDDKIQYFFKLNKGISDVKGGYNVLYELNYPNEIIENMKT
jgi:DNA mismatch repair ATPase MutS